MYSSLPPESAADILELQKPRITYLQIVYDQGPLRPSSSACAWNSMSKCTLCTYICHALIPLQSDFFAGDPQLSVLVYLDSLYEKPELEKSHFFKTLPKVITNYPKVLACVYHCTCMCSMHKCNYVRMYVCTWFILCMWYRCGRVCLFTCIYSTCVCMCVCVCMYVRICIRVCECGEYACKKYIRNRTLSTTSFAQVLRHYVGLQPK